MPKSKETAGFDHLFSGQAWLAGLALVLAVVLTYAPAWRAGFIWDDDVYVTDNWLLTAPGGLQKIWFSLDSPSQYFPLVYTSFRFERHLWGLNPAGYHCVNILLHSLNAVLLWRLLRKSQIPGAWLAAALFALHPVNVESVAWITERKNVLSLCFMLLAMLAWLEFIGESGRRRWAMYGAALACQALALFSKSTACTLPAALLLILWWRRERISLARFAQVVPFLLLGVGSGLLTMWWEQHHQGTSGKMFAMGLPERLLVASHAVWFYLGKLIWPANLTFSYPRWNIRANNPLAYGWLAAGLLAAGAILFARRRAGRSLETAGLFFVAMLSPMLGFIMLYTFRFSFVADHYQYVACIGPLTLAAAGITLAFAHWGRERAWLEIPTCGALLLVLAVLTWRQSSTYKDGETLWQTTLARNPDSLLAHNDLGDLLHRRGKFDEAMVQFQKALEIDPNAAQVHNNLGAALLDEGRVDEAIPHLQKALEVMPEMPSINFDLGNAYLRKGQVDDAIARFQVAIKSDPNYLEAHNNLGSALLDRGRVDEAIAQFQAALQINPHFAQARRGLAYCWFRKGRVEDATAELRKFVEAEPARADGHDELGTALLTGGKVDEAIAEFEKALQLQPDYADAAVSLGRAALALAMRPDPAGTNGARALELARQADQLLGGRNAVVKDALAVALIGTGHVNEALAAARQALDLATAQGDTQAAALARQEIAKCEAAAK